MALVIIATLAVSAPLIGLLILGSFTDRLSNDTFERWFGWLDRTK